MADKTLLKTIERENLPDIGDNNKTLHEFATHLFEEPGTLDQVIDAAADWFRKYLANP